MQTDTTVGLEYPGVRSALAYGWHRVKDNFLVFFLAVLVVVVLQAPLTLDDKVGVASAAVGLILFAHWLLLLPVLDYGADLVFLRGVDVGKVNIKIIIEGFGKYLNVVLAHLLVSGLIGIALVAFIVPGLYVAVRLAFVSYLVMDEELDPIEAVEASWRMTNGYGWQIFGLACISGLLGFVGLLMLGVGVIFAAIWAKAAFAALYLSISEEILDVDGMEDDLDSDTVED